MPKTTSFLTTILLLAIMVANCGSGQRSATLTRPTALALLKKKPELLAGMEKKVLVVQLPFLVSQAQASDDEIALKVPFALPNLDKLEAAGFHPDNSAYSSFLMGQFLIHAARDGLIFKPTKVERSVNWTEPGVYLYYSEIPHGDISWGYGPLGPGSVWAVIARPSYGAVTGVAQEGTSAVAQVQIVYVPTDAYRDIKKIVDETMKDMNRDPAMFSSLAGLSYCVTRCDFLKLPEATSATFSFQRYDDGWRVVGPAL